MFIFIIFNSINQFTLNSLPNKYIINVYNYLIKTKNCR